MSRGRHKRPSQAGHYAKKAAITGATGVTLVSTVGIPTASAETAPSITLVHNETTMPEVEPETTPLKIIVKPGDWLSKIAPEIGAPTWQELYEQNLETIGPNPNVIEPGQELVYVAGLLLPGGPPEPTSRSERVEAAPPPVAEAAPVPVQVAEPVRPNFGTARITNGAGPVTIQAQEAADEVFANVPGASLIVIGGTRHSAIDPNGHPSGRALDYMVGGDSALGDSILQYHFENWDRLGVEYVIWKQTYYSAPHKGRAMEDRGSITANHFDHPHVNYR